MSDNEQLVDIEGEIRGQTAKAYRFYDGKRTEWIPKSQCQWDRDDKKMTMPMWLATDKGFV